MTIPGRSCAADIPWKGSRAYRKANHRSGPPCWAPIIIIQETFNESVAPDKDGKTEKIEIMDDHAVLYYVVHKKGLKKMVRTEPSL